MYVWALYANARICQAHVRACTTNTHTHTHTHSTAYCVHSKHFYSHWQLIQLLLCQPLRVRLLLLLLPPPSLLHTLTTLTTLTRLLGGGGGGRGSVLLTSATPGVKHNRHKLFLEGKGRQCTKLNPDRVWTNTQGIVRIHSSQYIPDLFVGKERQSEREGGRKRYCSNGCTQPQLACTVEPLNNVTFGTSYSVHYI